MAKTKAKPKTKVKAAVNAAKTASRKLPAMPIVAVPFNGPYEAKRTGSNDVIARGAYVNGKRDGHWELLQDGDMFDREFVAGTQMATARAVTSVRDGLVTEHWPSGAVKSSCVFTLDVKNGLETEYAEDGTQTFKANWKFGFESGEHVYEDATIEWIDGLPRAVAEDDKALVRTRKLYEKAKYVYSAPIREGLQTCKADTHYASVEAWFLQLWRTQHVDVSNTDAHEMLQTVAPLISGEELLEMLASMKLEESYGWPIASWTDDLDHLVMSVYAHDPAPLDAAKLKGAVQTGVAFVRARHGKDVGNVLTKQLAAATKLSLRSFWWPDNILGPRKIDPQTTPDAPEYKQVRAMFGSDEDWCRGLKKSLAAEDVTDPDTHRLWIPTAKPEELAKFVDKLSDADWPTIVSVWRHDDAKALTTLASNSQLAALAVIAHHAEGSKPSDALLGLLSLRHQAPNFAYSERTSIESLQDKHGITHRAMQALPPARAKALIESALVESTNAAAFLYLVDDLELIDRTIDRILKESYPTELMTGVGEAGSRILDLLIGRLAKPGSAKAKRALAAAIVVALARTVIDEGAFDAHYDQYVDVSVMTDSYMRGFLERILRRLPRERTEAILVANLEAHLVEAFPFLEMCATEAVLRTGFTNLLHAKKPPRDLSQTIDWLPDNANWYQWLLDAGMTGELADEAQAQLGLCKYAET